MDVGWCSIVSSRSSGRLQLSTRAKGAPSRVGKGATWVDLGHYHNRGRVLECLAKLLGSEAVFVRVRRNRYDIAKSFEALAPTPCMRAEGNRHPGSSECPHSREEIPLVDLPLSSQPAQDDSADKIWERDFSTFQKYLWEADEVEHRWHGLKTNFVGPTYLEITWSNSAELQEGVNAVRQHLGCQPIQAIQNTRKHIKHVGQTRNCAREIREDLAYRAMMQFTKRRKTFSLPIMRSMSIVHIAWKRAKN